MKILRLDLDAFGPFSGESLDFSGPREGRDFHLIYGPNEAGKSSSLRAIGNLLYGIPLRSTDDFRFEYKKMRLGALLRHSDGSSLEFVRYKRNKDPLCAPDGEAPIPAAQLDRFLGGVDESLFKAMFGIGHPALVEGGKEIVRGGGRLGELLFSASSGIAGLRGIQEALQADLDGLFKAQGKNQRIAKAIAEVRDAQAKIKEAMVTTEEWSRQDRIVRDARAQGAELEDRLWLKTGESNRLKRVRDAFPLLSERAQLIADIDDLCDAIPLGEGFADRRRQAQHELARAAGELERARRAIADLEARIAAIEVPGPLLAAGEEIEALHARRGEYRKAQADRPRLASFLQDNEHAARDILQALGRPRDLAAADTLQLRADDSARIQQLSREAEKLATRRDEARAAIAKHRHRIEELRPGLDASGPLPDLEPLRSALQAAARLGDPEARRDEAQGRLEPLEKGMAALLRRMPGWAGTPDELESLAAPLPETVARFEADFQAAEARRRDLEADRSREEKSIAELEAKLHAQARMRDLPTEDDLNLARRRRDDGWRLIKHAWLEGRDDAVAASAFIADLAPGKSLADAYEQGIAKGDELADRLRREAREIASRDEHQARLASHRAQLGRIGRELAEADEQHRRLASGWGAATAPLGPAAMTPAEVRSWLELRDRAVNGLGQVRAARAEVDRLDRQVAEHSERLADRLIGLGIAPAPDERLAALIERARAAVAKHEEAERRRERLSAEIAKESADLQSARERLEAIEAGRDEWRGPWAEGMARIGLERDATPEQANVFVEKIRELHLHMGKAQEFRSRLKGIDRDGELFASDVAGLAARVATDLAGQPPDSAAEALYARHRSAHDDHLALRALRERIDSEEKAREAADRAQDGARLALEGLCREANCATPEELPEAERRSSARARCEADLRRCEEQIRALSAGATIEAFIAEAGKVDPDSLDLRIAGLDAEIAGIQKQTLKANQAIGAENQVLEAIDGSSRAAEANEQAGYALAQLQSDVPRYAALKLAAHILQQGIERYRERAQGPLIRRASELFAALSVGSFSGLQVEYTDRGAAYLVGVRPDRQTTLGVEGMSDGSCDQLYLALRIASLESWLAVHEPIPLIVDDILLQFDDDRSAAALRVLADLSAKTQVIFFTHHAHLIDLARATLGPDAISVHRLQSGHAFDGRASAQAAEGILP